MGCTLIGANTYGKETFLVGFDRQCARCRPVGKFSINVERNGGYDGFAKSR